MQLPNASNGAASREETQTSQVIQASEISDYAYCSISWKLKQQGNGPFGDGIVNGGKIHRIVGTQVEQIQEGGYAALVLGLLGAAALVALAVLLIRWLVSG